MTTDYQQYPNLLIAFGASAGAVSEFTKIVRNLPNYLQATLLFVCHRSPDGPNLLHELLAYNTELDVRQPVEGEKLCCTTIYLGKPRESVEVRGRYFHTEEDVTKLARQARIDDLFSSAARSAGENTVGVLLSGMLDDGVEGLKAIQRVGGKCFVQRPDDALFGDMPTNAIKSLVPDFIGTTEEICIELTKLAAGRTCK